MRILLANKYFFPKGGAETVFLDWAEMLRRHGHKTVEFSMFHKRNLPSEYEKYFITNVDYERKDLAHQMAIAIKLLYSFEAKIKIGQIISDTKPDLAHLNNIYHQISPSILHSIKKHGLPVVMSLHDCKLVCASYLMLSKGRICEACKGGRYYQCFLKKCVKDSRMKSLLSTMEMYLHHKILHIYDLVDVFISPSKFLKDKLEEMGFKGKIVHLPNFVNVDQFVPSYHSVDKTISYVGRLSREKGLFTLLKAVKGLDLTLKIIGDGPLKEQLLAVTQEEGIKNVAFLGYKSGDDLKEEIRNSMFTVLPSECYENNPRAVIESFALGKPVVGSRIGGIPELVRDNETGLTFMPFDSLDLRDKLIKLASSSDEITRMGQNARRMVEVELNAEVHYERLMAIYNSILKNEKIS